MAWDDGQNNWGHLEPVSPLKAYGKWDIGFEPDYNNPFTQKPSINPLAGYEKDPNNPFAFNKFIHSPNPFSINRFQQPNSMSRKPSKTANSGG